MMEVVTRCQKIFHSDVLLHFKPKLTTMKMQFKLLSIISAALIIFLSSCSRKLDAEPISSISVASFWKTESDVEGVLAGMYVQLRTEAQLNLFIFGEARAETMEWG